MAVELNGDLTADGEVVGTNLITCLDIGGTASTARPTGVAIVYWICDNGVTPTNAVEGDLIYNRSA